MKFDRKPKSGYLNRLGKGTRLRLGGRRAKGPHPAPGDGCGRPREQSSPKRDLGLEGTVPFEAVWSVTDRFLPVSVGVTDPDRRRSVITPLQLSGGHHPNHRYKPLRLVPLEGKGAGGLTGKPHARSEPRGEWNTRAEKREAMWSLPGFHHQHVHTGA